MKSKNHDEKMRMKRKLMLLTGGARSGKSSFAEKLAADNGKKVLYVATAYAGDEEMKERIVVHKAQRPDHWDTLEAQKNVGAAVKAYTGEFEIVLLDCMTMLTSNVIFSLPEPFTLEQVQAEMQFELDALVAAFQESHALWIIVTNEVGLGLVPDNYLGRVYRDVLGFANQRLAKIADEVLFMVSGIPMKIKG
ncbi:MAG: bifunctional adenosylcobinamide kinase/adenosylcobinamide-phosphate guanylyltransferase [Anaerolineaceae bacterium]|nr:bifunctional adenosylcobinamide kinase/adenosylcobinamide-phosphate guanylyltransferase [Anaerolineaceae bacterium]